MKTQSHKKRQFSKRQGGFTLVEVSVAMVLMSLLLIGTMDLFIAATRTTTRANAHVAASLDAANAFQRVTNDLRESLWFALADDPASFSSFVPPAGYTASQFQTVASGESIDTGIMLTFPNTNTASVCNSAGAAVPITIYDRTVDPPAPAAANRLWIYRADAGGVPNPASGAFLWATGVEAGVAVPGYAIAKSIDTKSPKAVQFVRPTDTSTPPVMQPSQVEIKIVCSYYSAINGQQTNESTSGTNASALSGKCVLMRDHEKNATHDPSSTTTTTSTSGSHWKAN